jgi:hypothetical protein
MSAAPPQRITRGQFLKAGASIIALLSTHCVAVTPAPTGDDGLQAAADSLVAWGRKLVTSYQSWGDSIDRQKLADALTPLNADLISFAAEKDDFLTLATSKTAEISTLQAQGRNLVVQLKDILRRIDGVLPRLAGHTGGEEQNVVSALHAAAFGKSLWLDEFLRDPKSNRVEFLKEGWSALSSVQEATKVFADLILKLNNG